MVNKLYFINVNFGKKLDAFLGKSANKQQGSSDEASNIKSYRGKLSLHRITLNFMDQMLDKVIIYLVSWTIKVVKRLLLDNCLMSKYGVYFCHYANKVHLIVFNLVLIDFVWLAPRSIMHARLVNF